MDSSIRSFEKGVKMLDLRRTVTERKASMERAERPTRPQGVPRKYVVVEWACLVVCLLSGVFLYAASSNNAPDMSRTKIHRVGGVLLTLRDGQHLRQAVREPEPDRDISSTTRLSPRLADHKIRSAIEWVESRGRAYAVGDNGAAIGILQIHRVTVDDVNRILGKNKYTYADRLNVKKSREMFSISSTYYCNYHKDWSNQGIARRWNGGPWGHRKTATWGYWLKVKARL